MKILFVNQGINKGIIPVKKYGGSERVLFWLMQALQELGHKVYLIAHPKSKVANIKVILIPKDKHDWRWQIPKDIDVIHFFQTPFFKIDYPYLITIGGNGQPGETFDKNTVFVSKKHMEIHGGQHFVYNGINFNEYPYLEKPKNWENFLFLAKAKWKVKNLNDCIKAVKHQNKYLFIAGGRRINFDSRIKYYGMVDDNKKKLLLSQCDALLNPVRWHEPFGVSIIEAMSMGLAIIGSTFGSLPELITPKTGYLCKNYQEFEDILSIKKNPFNPTYIRQYAQKKFSSLVMAEKYLKLYQIIKNGKTLHNYHPKCLSNKDPEFLQKF
jgi:glycosyltransferase involved in cell wall biosynthesis